MVLSIEEKKQLFCTPIYIIRGFFFGLGGQGPYAPTGATPDVQIKLNYSFYFTTYTCKAAKNCRILKNNIKLFTRDQVQ